MGDFDMVESPLERSTSSCSWLMGLKEELTWTNLKNKYNIEDYFSKSEDPLYSWDNLREDAIRALARLDKFYAFSSSIQNPSSHSMHYKNLGNSTFSDHHAPEQRPKTMPHKGIHGKPMGDSFKRSRNWLKRYGKPPLHKCLSSLRWG